MTMPKTLVFIRHGESQANELYEKIKNNESLTEKSVTHPDRSWGLTEKGKNQAHNIGQIFKKNGSEAMIFDRHYVSPYLRTRQTAGLLRLQNPKWELLREIRERSWGDIDSIPTKQFELDYPRNYDLHTKDPLYWTPPGGESLASVAEGRLNSFFSKLHRDNAGENVVCVAHHDIMLCARLVLEHMTDDDFTKKYQSGELNLPNASALIYTRSNPYTKELNSKLSFVKIVYINDAGEVETNGWSKIQKRKYDNVSLMRDL